LLGSGRCLARLDHASEAKTALDEARDLFTEMKAKALLAAVDRAGFGRAASPRTSTR